MATTNTFEDTTNAIGITNANIFMPVVWSKKVIKAAEANLVLQPRCWNFNAEAGDGQSIVIPKVSDMTAHLKVENNSVNLAGNSLLETSINLNLNYHYECSILVEDRAAKQSAYNITDLYTSKTGYAIQKAIDSQIAILAVGFTTNTVGTFNTSTITDENILDAIMKLDDANAPEMDRSFILKPFHKKAMMLIDKFVLASAIGKMNSASPVINGQFGEIYGVPVLISTNTYKTGSNTSGMLIHKEAIALAIQKAMKVETQRKLEYLATLVVTQVLFGCVVSRETFGCEIRG